MNEPHDPNVTADIPSVPPDSLDAGLAAGFARRADGPASVLTGMRSSFGAMRPVLLREAEGESEHVVKPKSDAMPSPKETGDRYHLSGEIARGGMGAVLRGRDNDLGRDLAFKILLEKYANRPEIARRFIEEAQIAGQLQHPGVVPVYDIGRFGERPFFTMKLVKGRTLAAILNDRANAAQDRPKLLAIALKIAETLAYAHAKGVIHRDLKPANIMVGAFGEVQVMDWGLAKVLTEGGVADEANASRMHQVPEDVTTIRTARSVGSVGSVGSETEAGSLLGTPAYMPPEQALGEIANVDRRADVFGLGAILCEILTGKPPYVGRTNEEVRRKASLGDLAEARGRLDECAADPELIALAKSCLSAEAMDRPKNAQAVADAFTAYLDGVQLRLHDAELAQVESKAKAAEERKRRRLTIAFSAALLALLAVGGGGLWWADHQAAQTRTETAIKLAAEESARNQRREVAERDVTAALNTVQSLIADARHHEADAEKMRLTLVTARSFIDRAETAVASGDVSEQLQRQVVSQRAAWEQAEKDRQLLNALELARMERGERSTVDGAVPRQSDKSDGDAESPKGRNLESEQNPSSRLYNVAFQNYGWNVLQDSPAETADRIQKHPHQPRLLISLAEWVRVASAEEGRKLADVLNAIEPPPGSYRARLRAALQANTPADLVDLAKHPQTLEQPAATIEMLANALISRDRRPAAASLLQAGVVRHVDDFWMHFLLGTSAIDTTLSAQARTEALRHLLAAVALRPNSARTMLNLGLAYHRQLDKNSAVLWYRRCLEIEPDYPLAHNNLAAIMIETRDYEGAIQSCLKAIERMPTLELPYRNLRTAFERGRTAEELIETLSGLAKRHPNSLPAQFYLAVSLHRSGHKPESETAFQKALQLCTAAHAQQYAATLLNTRDDALALRFLERAKEIAPDTGEAHLQLGRMHRQKGRIDDAMHEFERAATLSPSDALPYCEIALIYLDVKKDSARVVEYAKKAVEREPSHAWANNLLGCGLRDTGKTDDAIAAFKKSGEVDASYAIPFRNLGRIYLSRKEFDLAESAFREGERRGTLAQTHLLDVALGLRDALRYDDAIRIFDSMLVHSSNDLVVLRHLAYTLMTGKREFERAEAVYKKCFELSKPDASLHNDYGIALRNTGQRDKAIAAFEEAVRLKRDDANQRRNLALLLMERGDFTRADSEFQRAFSLDPKNESFRLEYVHALLKHTKTEQATKVFEQALALDPAAGDSIAYSAVVLDYRGEFRAAAERYQKSLDAGSKIGWIKFAMDRANRLAAAEGKLSAIQKGEYKLSTNRERLAWMHWAYYTARYRLMVRVAEEAFAADEATTKDIEKDWRYGVAICALLVAEGKGQDVGLVDPAERAAFRKKAHHWLREHLALHAQSVESGTNEQRINAAKAMREWLADFDLSSIRGADALAKLAPDERQMFAKFWQDIEELLRKLDVRVK